MLMTGGLTLSTVVHKVYNIKFVQFSHMPTNRSTSTVMEPLCEASFSKSTVSEVCKTLDEQVEEFRNRQLTEE